MVLMMGRGALRLDTWQGYACGKSIRSHVRFRTCELEFVIGCGVTCWERRVDMFASTVELNVWEKTMLDGTTRITSGIYYVEKK